MAQSKIKTGWQLAKQTLQFVGNNKKLLILPLCSTLCIIALFSFIIDPLLKIESSGQVNHYAPMIFAVALVFFFVINLLIIFFNAALIACAYQHFQGQKPSLRYGLKTAVNRLPQLFCWTLIATTIGIIIRAIETWIDRWPTLNVVISFLASITWTLATYFVVPVLVIDKTSPIQAIKRSSHTMHKQWGKSLTSNLSLGLFLFVALLVIAVPLMIGISLINGSNGSTLAESRLAGITLVALAILIWIGVSVVYSAARIILCGAIYYFSTTGNAPLHFDGQALSQAFKTKKKGRS